MNLSIRSEYALRALIALGEFYEQGIVRIQTISERQRIPKRFLEQILNDLRSGGFLESRRGMAGGYRLARPPQEITLAAVMQHVQGAPPNRLRTAGHARPDEVASVIQSLVKEVREAVHAVLENVSLADLCERARKLRNEAGGAADYMI